MPLWRSRSQRADWPDSSCLSRPKQPERLPLSGGFSDGARIADAGQKTQNPILLAMCRCAPSSSPTSARRRPLSYTAIVIRHGGTGDQGHQGNGQDRRQKKPHHGPALHRRPVPGVDLDQPARCSGLGGGAAGWRRWPCIFGTAGCRATEPRSRRARLAAGGHCSSAVRFATVGRSYRMRRDSQMPPLTIATIASIISQVTT